MKQRWLFASSERVSRQGARTPQRLEDSGDLYAVAPRRAMAKWRLFKVVPILVLLAATTIAQDQRRQEPSLPKYLDPQAGMTVDEAVGYALEHHGELLAARKEIEAARALVKQSALRTNPRLDASMSQNLTGADNNVSINGMLPLELGGRRSARVTVAQRELEVGQHEVAERERLLAAAVRAKFGEALADLLKLGSAEELLATSQRGYRLVEARVVEGNTPPLEQNMILVEVNRLRSIRENSEGRAEVALLELRNLIGMPPDQVLRLRGDFDKLIEPAARLSEVTERALRERPDLELARSAERLAAAKIAMAQAGGRADASLTAGYQRMNTGFPVRGINETGQLQPVNDVFHYLTFGISVELPVRNKNQGAIEAAVAAAEAARQRREFAELTVRREVAAAYARYERAARAMEIYRVGVREQASTNLNIIRQTYELGSKTLLDYIAEQRRYIELENGYVDTLLETYLARVEIARAAAAPELMKDAKP